MSWGTDIWGVHIWGGGPSTVNLSFEVPDAGGAQGVPDQWTVASDSDQEMAGTMEDNAVTWDPWEDYEEQWQIPFLVHRVPDVLNVVTSPDAIDQPTAIILVNELGPKYAAHLIDTDAHVATDQLNAANLPPATDYATLAINVMVLKYVLNEHIWAWPDVHRKWDLTSIVLSPDISLAPPLPGELPQLLALLNEIKGDFNNHIGLTGYGAMNDAAIFSFDGVYTPAGVFDPDLLAESYERAWSIPNLFPNEADQLPVVSVDGPQFWLITVASIPADTTLFSTTDDEGGERVFEFDIGGGLLNPDHVQVDISWVSTVIDVAEEIAVTIQGNDPYFWAVWDGGNTVRLIPRTGARASEGSVDPLTAWSHLEVDLIRNSWPTGHEELKSVFEYLVSQLGVEEAFEKSWLLPGSIAAWPNDEFHSRYWSGEEWRFTSSQTTFGITENFEADWKDNDVGLAAYWSGTEWRFLDSQITVMAIGSYTFGDYDEGSSAETIAPALPTPHYSPDLSMHVITALTDYAQIWTEFYDKNGATQSCYWHVEAGSLAAGSVIDLIGLTSIIADPRYDFKTQFNGIKQMKDWAVLFTTPVGKVELRGTKYVAETFEENWVLTLP